ncbi:MAG: SBBP repeat-containing protein [Phycisphaeraceae bacterium]
MRKYSPAGQLIWDERFGTLPQSFTEIENAIGLSLDNSGNIFVAGTTDGDLAGPNLGSNDLFLTKLDPQGTRVWTRQFGSAGYDEAWQTYADETGSVYVTGYVAGSLHGETAYGGSDAFVSKYDTEGQLLWTRQLGTPNTDYSDGIGMDSEGNLYVAVGYDTVFSGPGLSGTTASAAIAIYDPDGNLLDFIEFASGGWDWPFALVIDDADQVYMAGDTTGPLNGEINAGEGDGFVIKLVPGVPGDTDLDGDLDDTDLGTTFVNYTGPLALGIGGKTSMQGDADRDADVDDTDLGTAFVNYTGPQAPNNVPEPALAALVLMPLFCVARRRRADAA